MEMMKEAEISSALSTIYKEQGGMMGATNIGELPRNRQQISIIRSMPVCQFVITRVYEILWSWNRAWFVKLETNLLK